MSLRKVIGPLAQSAEHLPRKQDDAGSSPVWPSNSVHVAMPADTASGAGEAVVSGGGVTRMGEWGNAMLVTIDLVLGIAAALCFFLEAIKIRSPLNLIACGLLFWTLRVLL